MDIKSPEYEFPEFYHESYLVLLVRDPHCIYAYWELSPERKANLKQQFIRSGEPQTYLRVFDLTGLEYKTDSSHTFRDIAVHPMADNYFIKELEDNRSYRAELGTLDDGGFSTLLKSNTVHTPRNSMAEDSLSIEKQNFMVKEVHGKELLIGSFAKQGIYGDSKRINISSPDGGIIYGKRVPEFSASCSPSLCKASGKAVESGRKLVF